MVATTEEALALLQISRLAVAERKRATTAIIRTEAAQKVEEKEKRANLARLAAKVCPIRFTLRD